MSRTDLKTIHHTKKPISNLDEKRQSVCDNTEIGWMLGLPDKNVKAAHHKNDSMSNYEHV